MTSAPRIRVVAQCRDYELLLEVSDDTDFDSSFQAVDLDTGDVLVIHGWLWTFEPDDELPSPDEGGP